LAARSVALGRIIALCIFRKDTVQQFVDSGTPFILFAGHEHEVLLHFRAEEVQQLGVPDTTKRIGHIYGIFQVFCFSRLRTNFTIR